ncbi:MAG: FAD-dependent oxidoreductase, partial [Verrucomicrobiota bacterium]
MKQLIVSLFFAQAVLGIPTPTNPDIVVYSGVPCGIAASITAAREGAKVVLIEPTKHVGGLSTSGINTAETEHMLKWTIGGFADEFYRRLGKHYGTGQPEYYFESSVAEKVYLEMLKEAGVKNIAGFNEMSK